MTETTFTFRVDEELKAAFVNAAKSKDRTGAQLLRDFMRSTVDGERESRDHDAWFRAEVKQGLREAQDPKVRRIPDSEVRARWRRQHAALVKRAKAK